MTDLLKVTGLSRAFGGVHAVEDVTMTVREGSISALIGPNGAGKTTFFNLVGRQVATDAGSIEFRGTDLLKVGSHKLPSLGLVRTFQQIKLFRSMSVLENVSVGCHHRMPGSILLAGIGLPSRRAKERWAKEEAMRHLAFVGLDALADRPSGSLPYGQQRLVEIARCLAAAPAMVLLDEPAAGLNEQETERLSVLIRGIRQSGVTVLLVEHDMDLVMAISENVTVLDTGRVIADGPPSVVRKDPCVLRAYLGEEGC
jgi:branched-chain amino acid transport system ATP-binding protein